MESWEESDCIYVKVTTNWQCKYNMTRMKFTEISGVRIYNFLISSFYKYRMDRIL